MDKFQITGLCQGDIIEWTGNSPDVFKVTNVWKGNPQTFYGDEYEDYMFVMVSTKDNHSERISGSEMTNIHFIKKS